MKIVVACKDPENPPRGGRLNYKHEIQEIEKSSKLVVRARNDQ